MKFTPNERVIDLLIGQLLYSSPDATMRELLQNAEDACSLQSLVETTYSPTILVRYSVSENWVEVLDDGIGMNDEALERSFAAIGAHKEDVSHIRELLARAGGANQIGRFGVGILSCFGVAQTVTVWTKMTAHAGVAFDIPNLHASFQNRTDVPVNRGTRIRLQLKTGGPMTAGHVHAAIMKYVRHAKHIELEDVDAGRKQTIEQAWHGREAPGAILVEDEDVEGWLALHSAWVSAQSLPPPELVMCNAGFLVKEREFGFLPGEALGYVGEFNSRPGRLTLQLNREGFVQDERWNAVVARTRETYVRLITERVGAWERRIADDSTTSRSDIEQGSVLLTRGPTRSLLPPELIGRLELLVSTVVALALRGTSEWIPLAEVVVRANARGVIYYVREGDAPRQFQQSLSHDAASIQVTEVAQTQTMRVMHLRAKGELVVTCRQRSYSYAIAQAQQTLQVHDVDLLSAECQRASIRLVNVNDASPQEVELEGLPEGALIAELLGVGEQLKFVALQDTQERVIRDFAGKLLNMRHPDVQQILRVLPEVVGNPVRRRLLQIYLNLEAYNLSRARLQITELLTMPDLAVQAQLETGEFLRHFLVSQLAPFIEGTSGSPI